MLKRFGLLVCIFVMGSLIFPSQIWSAVVAGSIPSSPQLALHSFKLAPGLPDTDELMHHVNSARSAHKSPPLRANMQLEAVALARAADMAKRQYYAHKDPDGKYYYDLLSTEDIFPDYSCENLDLVFVPDTKSVAQEWLGSLNGHRECVINQGLVEAGYAVTKLDLIDFNGNLNSAYLIVAIHTTQL
jgi:hypothetical protein